MQNPFEREREEGAFKRAPELRSCQGRNHKMCFLNSFVDAFSLNRSTSLEFPPRLSVALYGHCMASHNLARGKIISLELSQKVSLLRDAGRSLPLLDWRLLVKGWQTAATFIRYCRISQVKQALPQYLSNWQLPLKSPTTCCQQDTMKKDSGFNLQRDQDRSSGRRECELRYSGSTLSLLWRLLWYIDSYITDIVWRKHRRKRSCSGLMHQLIGCIQWFDAILGTAGRPTAGILGLARRVKA